MIANYGYEDAAGSYFIRIDTCRCDGCGECMQACPNGVLAIVEDDYGQTGAIVQEVHRNKLRYSCSLCKSMKENVAVPCLAACKNNAITQSW